MQNDCHGSYYTHDGSNAMMRQRVHYLPALGLTRSCSKCSTGSFPFRCESNVLRNRPHKHMPRMASSTAKVGHIHSPSNRSRSPGRQRLSTQDCGILTRRKCRLSRGRLAPFEESEGGHTAGLQGGTCARRWAASSNASSSQTVCLVFFLVSERILPTEDNISDQITPPGAFFGFLTTCETCRKTGNFRFTTGNGFDPSIIIPKNIQHSYFGCGHLWLGSTKMRLVISTCQLGTSHTN